MADDNWQKVREIFDASLRHQPEERQNYLVEACGENKSLLAEVESLLDFSDEVDDFLETPAIAQVANVIGNEGKELEKGQFLGHYKIIEPIGTGGMGEVYLAQDTKLDRKVAVKILNEKFSQDKSTLNRFIQEAKSTSALNHPNILVIHEFGENEEAHFIVSEFIKGKTLRDIFREKTLQLSEVLDISIQTSNALVTAHEAHLIHRDIKPENIMIRPDGLVKVLDFGLAKLVERKNKSILGLDESTVGQNQTAKGLILGTVNYMSPEQAKGEKVDERTDIFSFGVLIYEMLAGRPPFQGESVSETFANLINQEPPQLSRFIQNIPKELERIISKMLRKDRDARYQTMKGLLADLKELKENLKSDEKLERSTSPQNGNATEVLQATTGDANLQTEETAHGLGRMFKWFFSTTEKTNTINFPKITRRRKGLLRGLKFLFRGLVVGFVFLILMKLLLIFSVMFLNNENGLFSGISRQLAGMIVSLIVTLEIPIGVGLFVGIGIFLFGIARIVYALFERESSKINPILIERVILAIVIIVILAVAIPNLMHSYSEANKAKQPQQISIGSKKSIAILPVQPLTAENRDVIYEFGIADSLTLKLGAAKNIIVRPLSATRKYADITQDAIAAGKEMQVDYVLASNYQIAAGKIRVTSQLFNVATGQIEETYKSEKDAGNIFATQDAIAGEVGNIILARFSATESSPKAVRGTNNEEAYRLYLQGMILYDQRGNSLKKALENFEQAVKLDPNYALAWAGIAHSSEYQKSIEAANKALALDPNLSEGYSALCWKKLIYAYDFAGAERDCKRAVELDPNSPVAHNTYSTYLASRGQFDEAIAEIKTAIDLDPTSYFNQRVYANVLYFARRYDEAVPQYKRMVEMNEEAAPSYEWLIRTLEAQGNESEAFEWFLKSLTLRKEDNETVQRFTTAYQKSGWQGVVLEREREGGGNYFRRSGFNARLGNKDKAFEYLEKSYQEHEWLIPFLQVEPQLDSLRDDPRYDELVRRVGLK